MARVFLVTGASSGIGEATARRLALEPGAELVLVARREERLRALADSLPVPATWVAADLTGAGCPRAGRRPRRGAPQAARPARQQRRRVLARALRRRGLGERPSGRWRLNFDAVVRLTDAALPLLRRSAPSAIVNVASTAGRISRPGAGAYSASKYALIGWSDSLHAEEREHGVHVGLVLPGFIATEGFPADRAAREAADALDGLDARQGCRGDRRRRPRRPRRALGAARLRSHRRPPRRRARAGPQGHLRRRRRRDDDRNEAAGVALTLEVADIHPV